MSVKSIFNNVYSIFSDYISVQIPQSISNVLWTIYNGLLGVLEHLEYKVDTFIRENNFLTAQHTSSLRALAAMNGFEPSLKVPSQGIVRMQISNSLYNQYGYPLYLPPYAEFKCKDNNLTYYFSSDKPLRLTSNVYDIPLIEGSVKTQQEISKGSTIERIYILNSDVAENSVSVIVDGTPFPQVKSFFDSGLEQAFELKFSHNIQKPLVLYIKGTKPQSVIDITYRTTLGTVGNLTSQSDFTTSDIIDASGNQVNASKTDLVTRNIWGFELASDGTSKDALRAAIGYNHSQTLLFDNLSYSRFISKYSTLRLQSITNPEDRLTHNIIRLYRKQLINVQEGLVASYQSCTRTKSYLLTKGQKEQLSETLKEQEYCLTTSELLDPITIKYALQIKYPSLDDMNHYRDQVEELVYSNFDKLLYTDHEFSLVHLLDEFKNSTCDIQYYIFCSEEVTDSTITNSKGRLPLLQGDFYINQNDRLFCDINHVI